MVYISFIETKEYCFAECMCMPTYINAENIKLQDKIWDVDTLPMLVDALRPGAVSHL